MLTIKQINRIYQKGFELRLKKNPHPAFKGEIDPATLEIFIYQANVESQYDEDITILHEFLHARDEINSADSPAKCSSIDKEAIRTYKDKPHVLEYIKDLYYLK